MSGKSTNAASDIPATGSRASFARWKWEALGLLVLAGLLAYFLKTSWRKWPDPIVDFGQQCYCIWRLSQGAAIYHDFVWNYGPLSAYFDAGLFRVIGPGIMVLAFANLLIYAGIVVLSYLALRRAWGWVGAFAALGVFIAVFSFSHLLAVGNYNYATPYSAEATHGMLLILVTAFVAARWCARPSLGLAFSLGFCGGLAVVIKPEFMLVTGVAGLAAYALRWAQRERVSVLEHAMLFGGLILPALVFMIWFARTESWGAAFIDANNAWWVVVVDQIQSSSSQQKVFSGFNHPLGNVLAEARSTVGASGMIALMWVAGWIVNRDWSALMRTVVVVAAIALAGLLCRAIDWMDVGRCLPGLMMLVLILILTRVVGELRKHRRVKRETVMALFLVLLAGTMLARMALYPHIFHLGFFQAALAGMVMAAVMVVELPRWTGSSVWGGRMSAALALAVLAFGCAMVAHKSIAIRADQIQVVGSGRDQFYSTTRDVDGTGVLVDWASKLMGSVPAEATLLVLPEGTMINYLSRHKGLEPGWGRSVDEKTYLEAMQKNPPDFVIFLTRDLTEFGITRFGAEGNFGKDMAQWVKKNYSNVAHYGGDPLALKDYPGAVIWRRKAG